MNKTELINAIAERIEGAKKGDIALILDTYAEVITDTLKADTTESVPVGKLGGVCYTLFLYDFIA